MSGGAPFRRQRRAGRPVPHGRVAGANGPGTLPGEGCEFDVLLRSLPAAGGGGPDEGVPSRETMRVVIVHSDALEALFDAKLEARLTEERRCVETAAAGTNRTPASC